MGGREGVLARDRRDGARHGGVARAGADPGAVGAWLVPATGRGAAVCRVRNADRHAARTVAVGTRGTDTVRALARVAGARAGRTGGGVDGGGGPDPAWPRPGTRARSGLDRKATTAEPAGLPG